ncbi:MAG: polysaccharide pyruvyl transferase family protein [Limisphaerales bacterium]
MGVLLFNPSLKDNVGTLNSNLGDIIISQAIITEIARLFPGETIVSISSHAYPGEEERLKIKNARLRVVGGTNVLSSDMRHSRQWCISGKLMPFYPAILCGVGWRQYEPPVKWFTRVLLKAVLSRTYIHSVRDDYTKQKLATCGIRNVVNTSCPTLWKLAGKKRMANEQKPAKNVLLMLTDYRRDQEADKFLVSCLSKRYDTIYFWPQGEMDLDYLLSLIAHKASQLIVLERTLDALDHCLSTTANLDYVGTRLHGGIRCLLAGKRSLILEVDNRAAEIAKETGLPTLPRTDITNIDKWVKAGWKSEIWVDEEPIKRWRDQFVG